MSNKIEPTRLFKQLPGLLALCLACLSVSAQAGVVKGYKLGASSYEQVYSSAVADIAVDYSDGGLVSAAWFSFGGQSLRVDFSLGLKWITNLKFGANYEMLGFHPGGTSLELAGKTQSAGKYGAVLQALVDQVIQPLDMELSDFAACHPSVCTYGLLGLGGSRTGSDINVAAIIFGPTGAQVDNALFQRNGIANVSETAGAMKFMAEALPELSPQRVPEPSSLALGLLALAALPLSRRVTKAKRGTGRA